MICAFIPVPIHQDLGGTNQVTLLMAIRMWRTSAKYTTTITGTVFLDSTATASRTRRNPLAMRVYLDRNFSGQISTPPGVHNPVTGGFDSGDPHVVTMPPGQYTFSELPPELTAWKPFPSKTFSWDNPSFDDIDVIQGQCATSTLAKDCRAALAVRYSTTPTKRRAHRRRCRPAQRSGLCRRQQQRRLRSMADIPAPTWTDACANLFRAQCFHDVNGNYRSPASHPHLYAAAESPVGVIPTSPTTKVTVTRSPLLGQNINTRTSATPMTVSA